MEELMDPVGKWIYSEDGDEFYSDIWFDSKEEAAEAYFEREDAEDWGYVAKIKEAGSVVDLINEWCIDGILQHIEEQTEQESVIPVEDITIGNNTHSDTLIDEVRQAFIKYLMSASKPLKMYDVEERTEVELIKDEDGNDEPAIEYGATNVIHVSGRKQQRAEAETKKESIIIPQHLLSAKPNRSVIWG